MTDRTLLTLDQVREGLAGLPGWELRENRLHREYRFADFLAAWDFMSACALAAHTRGHHPDWSNSYARVEVDLSTHDAGGITALDLELAREFEALARRRIVHETEG
jgi:4a-hydroxytetrahydrobiopterin dehydratase